VTSEPTNGNVELTPDHVPCRHCGKPISWDEVCWTHDDTGFADCGVEVSGGQPLENKFAGQDGEFIVTSAVLKNPQVVGGGQTCALPCGEWR
jgi:acetoacetate decarboxylase